MEGTFYTSVHSVFGDILLWMDYVSMGEIICTTYIYVSICEYAQVIFFFGRRAELEARRQREEEERLRLEEEQRKQREQIEADRRLAVCSLSSLVKG